MSGRRSGNQTGIRGPQSALTDFLAANNISAAQIRNDYEQRRRAEAANATSTADDETAAAADDDEEQAEEDAEEQAETSRKRKRTQDAIEKIKSSKKAKKGPEKSKKAAKKKGKKDSDDEDDEDEYLDSEDEDFVRDVYRKARKAPGQFANCESCNKRFTVTPYSKDGPEGGLLCTPCGKLMAKDLKAENKAAKPVVRKRRKMESDKLDGLSSRGVKTLQQMCIEKVVQNHTEVEELGDMPQPILDRLSAIFSKNRVLKPNTLKLFLRPDVDEVVLHDSAYLDVDDYKQIFAVVPGIRKLVIGNACQFKDEVMDYMLERCTNLKDFRIYAPNLVTNDMWLRLFREAGKRFEVVKLKQLDAAFEDETVAELIQCCPKLQRLKLKSCRRLTEESIRTISMASSLEHISLHLNQSVSAEALVDLVNKLGAGLHTLSLERFLDADDTVLEAVHKQCRKLSKLRFSDNDTATNRAFTALFKDWENYPLTFIDVNCTRDIDNNNPQGPEDAIGLDGSGFEAMMEHSGKTLRHLDIASCRHIELSAFLNVFNGEQVYPALEFLNISFCNRVDTTVIAGIFKSCPALKKLVAFGCFDIGEVVVPRDIALIGIPKAQDAIEQYGTGLDVDEALGRMIDVGA